MRSVDEAAAGGGGAVALERARGHARVVFRRTDGRDRLDTFYQQGCAKVRLPRVEPGRPPEAVLINTSGGITGGDVLLYEVEAQAGASLVATTQAAERIYRRSAGIGVVESRLAAGDGARLDWLPQETILFDGSALSRRLEVDLGAGAAFTAIESLVFGRTAMGETVRDVALSDRWRIRRQGRLVYADGVAIEGDAAAVLEGGATGGGARAVATILQVAEGAAERRDAARDLAAGLPGEIGVSVFAGLIVFRILAVDGRALRAATVPILEFLCGRPLPRVWHC
ncbi:urease accessory protein UreD [Prosthecomicrobium pneumaticum]|uniref:Urease accessory protein UreD n=1 Tax=Prosthecomicrobium pneumaticum TaxID=81895 RepID=A0A7W9FL80_9HYPH|nr:urease accessory protein UreD [Prosthecomicrobium pneumaticum]MBB5752414.1 urease accessory protein [Prosthecomicrobium pneumaticum]